MEIIFRHQGDNFFTYKSNYPNTPDLLCAVGIADSKSKIEGIQYRGDGVVFIKLSKMPKYIFSAGSGSLTITDDKFYTTLTGYEIIWQPDAAPVAAGKEA